ncbi:MULTISPECIES: histidinol dehydrogenase [unclassified Archaeoglobus]|jgi:histidinol dehydrogenase|uniref:histidinol dehydrogenase n=1 Tax=unclassified Archaeoglobus TaxID=2643606 RepID=UPI0025B8B36D|nr:MULTISPECIES: histidinol dehydrogenase [unclassified Archaeoglobus]
MNEILSLRREFKIDDYIEKVKPVVDAVRKEGDKAVIKFTKEFDGVELREIKVGEDEIDAAYDEVSDDLIDALEVAKENIERFHYVTAIEREMRIQFEDCLMGKIYTPIEKVGAYVPGGRASYPSTALMIGIPAKIAGVEKLIACTPPDSDGKIGPLTLVALDMAGFDAVYKAGGAQAIAAMAYGTESIPKVYKIVGPGNIFVTAAKLLVAKDVAIDMPAGPSEIMVIADNTANAEFIAYDCLAQLEHDPMAVAVVLTTSKDLAERVRELVEKHGSFENFRIAVVESIEKAIEISNEFAPEHLTIAVENVEELLSKIRNAGSVFLGNYSPVAAGDYASGTNHVLPTAGFARMFGGLSVESFMKHFTFQMLSEETMNRIGDAIIKIAEAEGLRFHAESVRRRLGR